MVVKAVIFDFYGTLAHFADAGTPEYETCYQATFGAHGYPLEKAALDDYYARDDGVEHGEHSISEEAYETWVRSRLRNLTDACDVQDQHFEDLVGALREIDQGDMVPYPEAVATLSSLRDAGLAIGVCSNWGWELASRNLRGVACGLGCRDGRGCLRR
jgi:putative hydrolase of the HAD superfamily